MCLIENLSDHDKKVIMTEFNCDTIDCDKIDWSGACQNTHDTIVKFCINHSDKIDPVFFTMNTNNIAVQYLIDNPHLMKEYLFLLNENDMAVEYFIKHPDKIDWRIFSSNRNDMAVEHCIKNAHMIDWGAFSENTNDMAVKYLMGHPDKIDWDRFIYNLNDRADKYLAMRPGNYALYLKKMEILLPFCKYKYSVLNKRGLCRFHEIWNPIRRSDVQILRRTHENEMRKLDNYIRDDEVRIAYRNERRFHTIQEPVQHVESRTISPFKSILNKLKKKMSRTKKTKISDDGDRYRALE